MASFESLPSMTTKSVVFPPPPPTTNALTPEQRAQLRKSTKKLGQILGATPQLLDTDIVSILGPVHIQLPSRNDTPSPVLSESSVDSYFSRSSSSCSLYPLHPYAAASYAKAECSPPTSSKSPRQGSFRFKSSSNGVTDTLEGPLNNTQAPVLRLAVSPPSPILSETSSSSSSSPSSHSPSSSARFDFVHFHSRTHSLDDTFSGTTSSSSDMKFTLRPTRLTTTSTDKTDDDGGSILEPLVNQSLSPSTIRRQKMNRLRRVLGDEVPVHLVFPDQKRVDSNPFKGSEEEDDDNGIDYTSSPPGLTPVAVAGTAIPRPKKVNTNKIVATRDSMGTMTPHRAKRQEKEKQKMEKSGLPSQKPSTSSTIVIPGSCIPKGSSSSSPQKQLCVIVESPEEHGTSSFEGFGFGSSISTKKIRKSSLLAKSSWHIRDGSTGNGGGSGKEDVSKLWSTRKGYTGWDRSVVKSDQERKTSMSYRKPPPSVDF